MGGKAALIHIIGFGFILGYISMNLNVIAGRAQGNMSAYAAATESHNLAITGANVGLARFYQDTSWRGSETQVLSGALNGDFTYSITNSVTGVPVLKSVAKCRGIDGLLYDTVVVVFGGNRKNSFTLFAYMSDFEGNDFWYTGDTVWGRIHTNGRMHMTGSPVFMEKLTASKGLDPKWGKGGNDAIFKHGFETGVAKVDYPTNIAEVVNAATSGGRSYAGDIEVALEPGTGANDDGIAIVSQGGTPIDTVLLSDLSFNGALLGTGNVTVQGTLDGELSIASQQDIQISDDILYENRNWSTSDDVLGLIAEDNVVILDNVPNSTNCYVDGSIFTRAGSFEAEDYNKGAPRGTFKIVGSIVQQDRGQLGTYHVGSHSVKTGYSKRFVYDKRLENPNFRPPHYPGYYTKTRAIAAWWENVHVPKFN
ncbi:MAG: hypothetical protein KAJ12_04510 [Bacteroidetes bacterium]|nr:hypothetical protein [Bacteroidota bacterium]